MDECRDILLHCNILYSRLSFTINMKIKTLMVPSLENEGHWRLGTFPKTRKLEMGCSSNFRYKFKEKGHGPLSRWVDFLSGVIQMDSI